MVKSIEGDNEIEDSSAATVKPYRSTGIKKAEPL